MKILTVFDEWFALCKYAAWMVAGVLSSLGAVWVWW